MAQLVNVRLNRSDAQPWGFRLQGGKDFGTPLVVQKVAGGSIAANAGLVAGDAVIKVNGQEVYNLRHKDAQDAVVRGGNSFDITVQRGGSTWRPTVSPAGNLPSPSLVGNVAPVTRTSLAAKPQEVQPIGSGFNSAARPFAVNGSEGVKSIVNKQYNTPVGIYSDESIAETLSAQAEVLAGGVLGVNFKKNERIYNSANSEVYKMLQEAENDPNEPAGESKYYWTASHAIGGQATCTSPYLSPGASHRPSHPISLQDIAQQEQSTSSYSASVSSYQENTKLSATTISAALTTHHGPGAGATNGAPQLGSPLSTTSNINTNISGPKPFNFSSAPLSPLSAGPKSPSTYPPPTSATAWSQPKAPSTFETPKPSTFGSATLPRANVGPTAPDNLGTECGYVDDGTGEHFMWPPPNAGVDSATPTATPLYVPPPGTQHVIVKPMVEKQSRSAPELSYGQTEVSRSAEVVEMESGSESYTSTSATTTSEDAAHMRMYQTQTSVPSYTIYESADSDANEVDYAAIQHHKQSICSAEVSSFSSESRGAQYLANTLDTTCLVERMRSLTPRPPSPPPIKPAKHVEFAIPHEEQTTTEVQQSIQEATEVHESQIHEVAQTQEVAAETVHLEEQSTQFQPIDIPEPKPLPQSNIPNAVPQEWESAMVKALKTAPETPYHIVSSVQQEAVEERCEKIEASQSSAVTTFQSVDLPPLDVLVEKPAEGTIMSSLLTTVPSKSVKFEPKVTMEPVPLPEETKPYFPPPIDMKFVADDTIPGRKSGMLEALITAPDRPYSPFGHDVSYQLDDLPRPTEKVTLRNALTVAPDRPFTPVIFDSNGLAHPKQETICSTSLASAQTAIKQSCQEQKSSQSVTQETHTQQQSMSQVSTSQTSAFQSTKSSMQQSQISASQSCQQECRESVCQQVCQSRQISEQSKTVNRIMVDTAAAAFEQDAGKPASGPTAFKPLKPPTPPSTNNCPSTAMSDPSPDASAGPNRGGAAGVTSAPKRGRGVLNKAVGPGGRIPQCGCCNSHIRGPFITALGRIWCPDHFICVNAECRRPLADIGFVEEKGNLYCEYCFEKYIAPSCSKCSAKIKGDCLNAIGKHFHPECFTCAYCGKLFGNSPFFLEEGNPYCEADWNELFTTKCFACGFPVEAGDRWVEALSHNYHSQCFNCTTCKKNLEGQSFFAKGGRPYCKNHAR